MYDIEKLLSILPQKVAQEISRLAASRRADGKSISEIRLRAFGRNSVTLFGERVCLCTPVSEEDIKRTVTLICGGSLYAHRDSIKEGYVTLDGCVRVGICGQARYDGGDLVGVSNISSLVFRIPTEISENAEILYDAWLNVKHGMIIYSKPGVGKTTALRTLASLIGGRGKMQVAIIDGRCEFSPENYKGLPVDLFRGYRRAEGMEIALRVVSPDVMIIDEIGRRGEAEMILESLNSGVKVIATAHADSFFELKKRISLAPFFDNEIFDVAVGLSHKNGRRQADVRRIL